MTVPPAQQVHAQGNVGIAGQDVFQVGNIENSKAVAIGKDISISADTYHIEEKPAFFKPNLDWFATPYYISPRSTPQLMEQVSQNKLILIGGASNIDKLAWARHIAWRLAIELEKGNGVGPRHAEVLEWQKSSDPQSLFVTLQQTKSLTIFILPDVEPQHVNYDLLRIQQAAERGGHYVIASTEAPQARWHLTDRDLHLWYEVETEGLYEPAELTKALIDSLQLSTSPLPAEIMVSDLKATSSLIGSLRVQEAAKLLQTPDNISVFVRNLCAFQNAVTEPLVRELIEDIRTQKRIVHRWFHNTLSYREQLLALGLSLFDGLFDDQCFAALESVFDQVWRGRDVTMRALDYLDMENVSHFFSRVDAQTEGMKIESRLADQRLMIFQAAWNSHRRQLLTALSALEKLIIYSVPGAGNNYELYGSTTRRDQLRRVIGEVLSDIGLIYLPSVETTLLHLAADDQVWVQTVAAMAMARWRSTKDFQDETLFSLLKRWQNDSRFVGIINAIRQGRNQEETYSPAAYIRATVALTVSYAAQYDAPDYLSQEIVDLLDSLADDSNQLVQRRFRDHTLPMVIPLHLNQLCDLLHDLTRDGDLDMLQAIGNSLALAYRQNPQAVISLLEGWTNEAKSNPWRTRAPKGQVPREHLLAAIALTYGEIRYEEQIGPLTADNAFERLKAIMKEEQHPFVRSAVILALRRQAKRKFEEVEPLLQRFITQVTSDERGEIVKLLRELYLDQRAAQEGGDDVVRVNGRTYPVWIDSVRPVTQIEIALYRWLKDASNPAAQRIATRAFVSFANALDLEGKRQVEQKVIERDARQEAEERAREAYARSAVIATDNVPISARFGAWMATQSADYQPYRETIRGILPEILEMKKLAVFAMDHVFGRWEGSDEDEDIQIIGEVARSAAGWAQNFWLVPVGIIVIVMIIILVISG